MDTVSKFKKSFFLGRLIWLTGKAGPAKEKRLREWLWSCRVAKNEVCHMSAKQFIDAVSTGFSKSVLIDYEVIQVSDFELLEGGAASNFLRAIRIFRELQMGLAMRLLLVSEEEISPDLQGFSEFSPIEISLADSGEDPGGLNERVHNLLEAAMAFSRVPVKRISEKAAIFLEIYSSHEDDHSVLTLLLDGLTRSDGQVLRFADLYPEGGAAPKSSASSETHCN